MSSCRLTRSYAVTNLEDMQPAVAVPAKHRKLPRNANDTESDNEASTLGALKVPEHGQPAEVSELSETVAPSVGKDVANSGTGMTMRKPGVVNRKVVPPRSPLPSRATRPVHPGAPDMVKSKRTSAEVTAAAERKAALQRQADELEQKKIDTLAEIELEEELAEEEEERTMVRKQAHTNSLDDAEDIIMEFEDEVNKGASITEEISEFSSSEKDPKAVKAKTVPKQSQVCFFSCCRCNKY
jgi:hypothetical protein